MIKLNLYSSKGVKKGIVNLPRRLEEKPNLKLLAQALRVYDDKEHGGLSKTKSRGEISLSKRKIWRQKGTGRARHGARSAPIFVGGGTTHGPKGIKRTLNLPRKMRQKALKIALSIKVKNKKVILIDGVAAIKKTKGAASLINKIAKKEEGLKGGEPVTVILSESNSKAMLAFRNLENVDVVLFKNLNAYGTYYGGVLLIDKEALKESKKSKTVKSKK